MRIGLVTTLLDEKITGVGQYTYHLARALLDLDRENEYIFIHRLRTGHDIYRRGREFFVPHLPTGPLRNIAENIRLARHEDEFDIVHEPFLGLFMKARFRKVVTVHDLTSLFFRFDSPVSFDIYFRLVMPRVVRGASAVLADSEATRKDILHHYGAAPDKVTTVYPGVEERPVDPAVVAAVREKFSLDQPFILFVGTPMRRKNLAAAIRAFAKVRKDGERCRFVIAGKKEREYGNLMRLARRLGLERDVLFTGYLDDEEIRAIYRSASLLVYPSLYEGFGFPLLEAMAQSIPVACSNVSSLPEVAGDAAITFDPGDVDDIARAIKRGLTDDGLRKELVGRGRLRVKEFTWEKTASRVLQVYNRVGGGGVG